jgi:hypothetical protein
MSVISGVAKQDKMQSVEHRVEEQRKMTAEKLQDKESTAAATVAIKEAKLKQRQLVAENKKREKANTERLDAERVRTCLLVFGIRTVCKHWHMQHCCRFKLFESCTDVMMTSLVCVVW